MTSSGKIATILGGTGFLGRYIVYHLAKAGYLIRIPTRTPDKVLPLKSFGEIGQITAYPADNIQQAISGSDLVINLVGILYETRKCSFEALHTELPKKIAKAVKLEGVKQFIHVSALGADPNSTSKYAQTKARGEEKVLKYFPSTTIIRPSVIFGPEDNFFNMFARFTNISPFLPLIGGGKTLFQPVYVDDVAKAILKALQTPKAAGQIYELGGPQILSLKDLMQILLKTLHKKRVLAYVPWFLASIQAFFFELMPHPLLTRDQVKLLRSNNIVNNNANGFAELGIKPTSIEVILPTYL